MLYAHTSLICILRPASSVSRPLFGPVLLYMAGLDGCTPCLPQVPQAQLGKGRHALSLSRTRLLGGSRLPAHPRVVGSMRACGPLLASAVQFKRAILVHANVNQAKGIAKQRKMTRQKLGVAAIKLCHATLRSCPIKLPQRGQLAPAGLPAWPLLQVLGPTAATSSLYLLPRHHCNLCHVIITSPRRHCTWTLTRCQELQFTPRRFQIGAALSGCMMCTGRARCGIEGWSVVGVGTCVGG